MSRVVKFSFVDENGQQKEVSVRDDDLTPDGIVIEVVSGRSTVMVSYTMNELFAIQAAVGRFLLPPPG